MEKETKNKKLARSTVNIFRTTQRNNIDLTAIADNKANVLLSINAIMLTFIIPLVLGNVDFIIERYIYVPLVIFAVTCFSTIYIAAQVLKPTDFDKKKHSLDPMVKSSPFFFGNFYKMEVDEYYQFLQEGLANENFNKAHLAQDLYYIGRRLGYKMANIRVAFNLFILGLFLTLVATAVVLIAF